MAYRPGALETKDRISITSAALDGYNRAVKRYETNPDLFRKEFMSKLAGEFEGAMTSLAKLRDGEGGQYVAEALTGFRAREKELGKRIRDVERRVTTEADAEVRLGVARAFLGYQKV